MMTEDCQDLDAYGAAGLGCGILQVPRYLPCLGGLAGVGHLLRNARFHPIKVPVARPG